MPATKAFSVQSAGCRQPLNADPLGRIKKRAFVKLIASLLVIISLAACAATPLHPGAGKVRLTNQEPDSCKFLGDVTGSQGNQFTGELTSNSTMETGARNDIKNKARAMDGNVVHLLTQRAGVTGAHGGSSYQSNVTLTGNVYSCPE